MRPTPHHRPPTDEKRSIIYLGDVRRKRAVRQRAPDRHYLAAWLVGALLSWLVWLIVVFTVAPARLLTYLAFFVPLWVALSATGAVATYAIEWKYTAIPSLRTCARRGAEAATAVIANIALLAAHRWNLLIGASFVVAAVLLEVGLTRRKR